MDELQIFDQNFKVWRVGSVLSEMLLAQSVHLGHAWPIMWRQKWKLTTHYRDQNFIGWRPQPSRYLYVTYLFLYSKKPQFCGLLTQKQLLQTLPSCPFYDSHRLMFYIHSVLKTCPNCRILVSEARMFCFYYDFQNIQN